MRFRRLIPLFLAAALPALAFAQSDSWHRVELKPSEGKALPYTIEVPGDWQVRQVEGAPGLWIGPAEAKPPQDPRLIWVRGSNAALGNPEAVATSIRETDAKEPSWAAPRVEVKDLGGVRGVLVRMDTGEGDKARSTLALKVPFQTVAVDFMASAGRADFEKMLPTYERILLSVRPAADAAK
ncbi:MAG TPA: hypothetical protein VG477_06795 [Thermoanaerobaculia bacterium]|nr:hypothetical protein [Thermoanaerobaculia bacterium]